MGRASSDKSEVVLDTCGVLQALEELIHTLTERFNVEIPQVVLNELEDIANNINGKRSPELQLRAKKSLGILNILIEQRKMKVKGNIETAGKSANDKLFIAMVRKYSRLSPADKVLLGRVYLSKIRNSDAVLITSDADLFNASKKLGVKTFWSIESFLDDYKVWKTRMLICGFFLDIFNMIPIFLLFL